MIGGSGGEMMGGGMWLMGMLWFLLIAGGIAVIVWVIARGTAGGSVQGTRGPISQGGDRALATLRERFARGEIDEAEYRQRRQALDDE